MLTEVVESARRAVESGDHDAAESHLARGAMLVDHESDVAVLQAFADLAHEWGPEAAEEVAVRGLLKISPGLPAILRLLDLLQARLNGASMEELESLSSECIELGTRALRILRPASGPDWANAVRARAARHLEQVRLGKLEHADLGLNDIHAFVGWVRDGDGVPSHWQTDLLVAQARVDEGEILLLTGDRQAAAVVLEKAVESLEARGTPDWMTAPAYELLERAAE